MASKSDTSLIQQLFSTGLYKANQGRMVRQFTFLLPWWSQPSVASP
jgi:hypothetical protein